MTTDRVQDPIVSRYSALARAALGGEVIRDCEPSAHDDGCLGALAYSDTSEAPEAALRASLGCGTRLPLRTCSQERPSWISVLVAALTSCSPRAGSGRTASPTDWTPARKCLPWRAQRPKAGRHQRQVPKWPDRKDSAARQPRGRHHLELRH